MQPPLFITHPKAGKDAYTAFRFENGRLEMARAPRKEVEQATRWNELWTERATAIVIYQVQSFKGKETGEDLELTVLDDQQERQTVRLAFAAQADRDRLLAALREHPGVRWNAQREQEARWELVGAGLLTFAAMLFLAWLVRGVTHGELRLPGGLLLGVHVMHGGKAAAIVGALMAAGKYVGPEVGSYAAQGLAGIGGVAAIFIGAGQRGWRFVYTRP